jgi:hypothetical protein
MCYNCGCGETKTDHGDPRNITEKTFEEAAKAAKLVDGDAKQNTVNLLKKKGEAV